MRFGWDFQRSGFNGTSNPGQTAVRRVLFGAMGGFGDSSGYLSRGSRLRWSGLVPEGFISGYFDNAQIRNNIERRGFTVEDLQTNYDSVGWDMIPLWRLFVTVVTPVDWNQTDAFGVLTNEVAAAAGSAPTDIRQEVLLTPYAQTSSGQPVYPSSPGNIPGGSGSAPGAGILDSLAKSLNITQQTAQWLLIGGLGLVAFVTLKGGRR